MAIYHFSAKVISRASGSSAVAAAAYRCAGRLHDQRLDRHHDFSNKTGVVHSEVLLPDGAPEHLVDRSTLWNAVEAGELRKDAQLAREIEFAIPRELDQGEGIRLAREFVTREFVDRGMIADLNMHRDIGADGEPKPHAHVMLTMREVGADGFGAKVRDWNRTDLLDHWREAWAEHANARLAELDIDARIDHRSLEAQGIALQPQHKIGPAASRRAEEGLACERLAEHRDIARANGEKLLANPALALDAITHQQATFTTRDLAKFVHRHSDGKEQFDRVFAAVRASPELVALGRDGRGQERFTSRDMLATEQRLERVCDALSIRTDHGLAERTIREAIARSTSDGLVLGEEQQAALRHVLRSDGLSIVVGYAGTGKSAMLGVARDGWEQAGYRVRGAALSGIAAENLEHGSGISSRTIASLEHRWAKGEDLLTNRDVLVIDEAGMIGTRQMERVITEAEKRGAKVVLVGDPEQLQAIEAGAAFRSITERHGAYELTVVRRQKVEWQREATRHLATERTVEAIEAYADHGSIHPAATRDDARHELIDRWDRDRAALPDASRIILTHTNDEVLTLNQAARERLRASSELGKDVTLTVEKGERMFAASDRVMFGRNDRSLSVKNGSLGRIESVTATRMSVRLDDGRSVAFDLKDYAAVDHGYAATIHKAQGMTVDRTYLLATPGLDRHAAYVALSRHRDAVDLHYGRDDFADQDRLVRTLSRERGKDMATDYQPTRAPDAPMPARRSPFAGLKLERAAGISASPQPSRSPFAGLDLGRSSKSAAPVPDLGPAIQRCARAVAEILRVREDGYTELPHQKVTLDKARHALDAKRPDGWKDLRTAFDRNRSLIDEAASGRTSAAHRAMMLEAELRTSPKLRADRIVDDLSGLVKTHQCLHHAGDDSGMRAIGERIATLGRGLERDAQAESLVRKRLPQIGIPFREGHSTSRSIQDWLGRSRNRGIER